MEIVEIDKELEELEVKIDQLRGLYEQYFMGLEKLEPQIPRKDVEKRIKILRKEQIRNTAQRFKFNMLAQRINTLSQHWGRVVREIENGTYKRDVMRAAARFGEGALVGMGKKAKRMAAAAAATSAQSKRSLDDAMELGADDLIEDEEEDEVPTPPKLELPPVSGYGLGQGDLPVVGGPRATRPVTAQPVTAQRVAAQPVAPAPVPSPSAARAAGLRWGATPAAATSDPASAIRPAVVDVKRRVAELAAELRAGRQEDHGGAGFGELDLDFNDGAGAARRTGDSGVRVPSAAGRPSPAGAPPRSTESGGFGVLDVPLEAHPAAPVPAPRASSPGSGIRTGMGAAARSPNPNAPIPNARPIPNAAPIAPKAPNAPPGVVTPKIAASPPAAAPVSGSELGDQRIRQIYAKYVEAKRSTHESTAGVTFEKLASSLRAQAEKLKGAHPSKSVDYEVVVKDGKTHLKPVLR